MTLDGKMRILLCEDDENLGMLLREYLQAKGYDTVLCSDGEEGYREFLRSKYNLLRLRRNDAQERRLHLSEGNPHDQLRSAHRVLDCQNAQGRCI